ncbi:MAG: SMI1/KNR4 family protein [Streptococcaceae bacterium]|jgi:hypothetical protein|nr:SMI1/KNR4 family protein [Streptococcaceae bacterium]
MAIKLQTVGNGLLSDIKVLEKEFKVTLPEDYKQFLIATNGGYNTEEVDGDEFQLHLNKEKIVSVNIDMMFGINIGESKFSNEISAWTTEYSFDIPENTIIIGRTIQAGFILYYDDLEDGGYYYYDHTYFFEESSDESNTYWLCDTFEEFQNMVTNPS